MMRQLLFVLTLCINILSVYSRAIQCCVLKPSLKCTDLKPNDQCDGIRLEEYGNPIHIIDSNIKATKTVDWKFDKVDGFNNNKQTIKGVPMKIWTIDKKGNVDIITIDFDKMQDYEVNIENEKELFDIQQENDKSIHDIAKEPNEQTVNSQQQSLNLGNTAKLKTKSKLLDDDLDLNQLVLAHRRRLSDFPTVSGTQMTQAPYAQTALLTFMARKPPNGAWYKASGVATLIKSQRENDRIFDYYLTAGHNSYSHGVTDYDGRLSRNYQLHLGLNMNGKDLKYRIEYYKVGQFERLWIPHYLGEDYIFDLAVIKFETLRLKSQVLTPTMTDQHYLGLIDGIMATYDFEDPADQHRHTMKVKTPIQIKRPSHMVPEFIWCFTGKYRDQHTEEGMSGSGFVLASDTTKQIAIYVGAEETSTGLKFKTWWKRIEYRSKYAIGIMTGAVSNAMMAAVLNGKHRTFRDGIQTNQEQVRQTQISSSPQKVNYRMKAMKEYNNNYYKFDNEFEGNINNKQDLEYNLFKDEIHNVAYLTMFGMIFCLVCCVMVGFIFGYLLDQWIKH